MINISDIELFNEHVKDNMLPADVPQERRGKNYSADDWTIEVCEDLIEDRESLSSSYKRLMYKVLQEVKDDADTIFIGEVGRGLDILICLMVKEWENIICYDHNDIYKQYLDKYFWYDIDFHPMSSSLFLSDVNVIKEKCIMIMNHSKVRQFDVIEKNKNIVHLIFDGKLLW